MESSIFEQVNFPYYWGYVFGSLASVRRRQIVFCNDHPNASELEKDFSTFVGDIHGKRSPYRKINDVLIRLRTKLGADFKNSRAWRKWMEDFNTMIMYLNDENTYPNVACDLTCIRLSHELY